MHFVQYLGDAKTLNIPLSWNGRAFVPGSDYNLLFTLKGNPTEEDDAVAAVQKMSGFGISVIASTALVSLIPFDTTGGTLDDVFYPALSPGTYFWDVQAQAVADETDVRSIASGSIELLRDVSRGVETSVPVFQAAAGLTYESELITYS
jgi:hypothetical protein